MSEVLIGAALEAFFTVAFEKAIAAAQLGSGDDTRPPGIGLQEPASSAVRRHLEMVGAWSEFVQFKDLPKPRRLHEIFVDLDLQLTPRHLSLARTGESKCASIQDLVNIDRNFVLLGDVGAGKTTSMKRLVRATLGRFTQTQAGPCPVLFLLRDLDDQQCLAERILTELGVRLEISDGSDGELTRFARARQRAPAANGVLAAVLSQLSGRLFLDGLDEVPTHLAAAVVADLRYLCSRSGSYSLAVSCRSAAYQYSIERTETFEIRPLTRAQISTFARQWLVDPDETSEFLKQIEASPYTDTAVRPLTLSHLCALYLRYRRIPEKPRTVYRKLVRLLLEEWSLQWSVTRSSAYAGFEVDRKQEFLERLAWEIPAVTFSHAELEAAYKRMSQAFNLPVRDAPVVAQELESHTGLIVQTAYEQYSFAHKSLHEYLAAEYLVKAPSILATRAALRFRPSEFAVATSLSARPGEFFSYVVFTHILPGADQRELEEYVSRVALERPDFEQDPLLGLALLVCDFRGFFVETPSHRTLPGRLRALQQLPNVKESLALAARVHLDYVQTFENGDLMFRVKPSADLPAGLPAYLRVAAEVMSGIAPDFLAP